MSYFCGPDSLGSFGIQVTMSRNERDLYIYLCETNKVSVDPNISKALSASSSTSLDLSSCSISKETCEILSKILISSTAFHELNLADCLLPARGLIPILKSLSQVACLTSLNLKGNNISGTTIVKLGQMLSNNSSIKILGLEWNSLGLFPDSFKEFCSGLAKNSCIENLDLQNNRLSPESAVMLSDAITCNSSLKTLDIRWNEVGWKGGQCIFESLQNNTSLATVQLQGNGIPGDLLQAIEQCAAHNSSHQKVIQECSVRNHLLTKHVRRIEAKRSLEIESLSKQNEEIIKETEIRLNSVEEVLSEKNTALANAHIQLKSLQAELRKCEHSKEDLDKHAKELEDERILLIDKHKADSEKHKKKHNEEIHQLTKQLMSIENLLTIEKEKVSELHQKVMVAEDKLLRLQGNQKTLMEVERKRHEDEMESFQRCQEEKLEREHKEFEEKIRSIKTDANRTHQRLTERISSLETTLFDLERKLSEQSTQALHMSQELARSAETTALAVQEAKEKEMIRMRIVEENLEAARDGRLRAEKQLEVLQRNLNHLQEQNSALIAELGEPQKKLTILHEELSREKEMVSRLRAEKNEEVVKGDALKVDINRLQIEVNTLTRQIGEIQNNNLANEQRWRDERDRMQGEILQKEREIQQMRSDERERAAALHLAFSKYLGNVHPTSPSLLGANMDTIR